MRKFAHSPRFEKVKGKIKVTCSCGVQSPKLGSEEEAQAAYDDHLALVGIVERQKLR